MSHRLILSIPKRLIVVFLLAVTLAQAETQKFKHVQIENDFRDFLTANPLLMEMAGAKVVRFEDGSRLLLAVGYTEARPDSPQERMRRIRVAQSRAQAALAAEQKGVLVATSSSFSEKSVITIVNGVESGMSVSETLETTASRTRGIILGLPVIGTWMSEDEGLFYLAIGRIFQPEDLKE